MNTLRKGSNARRFPGALRNVALGIWSLFSVSTFGQDGQVLFGTCIACHGANGFGNTALGAPAIAGQQESYLQRQLDNFRSGVRGAADGDSYGAQMVPFAMQLADDNAVAAVAAYAASLPVASATSVDTGDARRGANLYNGNCGACHGGSGEGNDALNSPRLAGLDAIYLKRQYESFASGLRGANPDDRLGRQMAMMAKTLPDAAAIDDVIAHIVGLSQAQ
ncbi:MAG: c-type cytochrome [Pseudomonadota bacterium]